MSEPIEKTVVYALRRALPTKEQNCGKTSQNSNSNNGSNLTYGAKYYLFKWIKQLLQRGEFNYNPDSYKFVKNVIDIFNLHSYIDIDKYGDEQKQYFSFGPELNFMKDYMNALSHVRLKKEPDLFLLKLKWIKEIYGLENNEDCVDLIAISVLILTGEVFDTLVSSYALDGKHRLFRFILEHVKGYCQIMVDDIMFSLTKTGLFFCDRLYSGHVDCCSLNPLIEKAFSKKELNTRLKFVNYILGEKCNASLKLQDFKHIKNSDKVINILRECKNTKGINILLYGDVGTGKTEFSKVIAKQAGMSLYPVITQLKDYGEPKRQDRLIDLLSKQTLLSRLKNSCILFDEAEDVLNYGYNDFGTSSKGYMNHILENVSVPVIWTTNNIWDVDPAFLRRMTYCIEFKSLTDEQRLHIWKRVLKQHNMRVNKNTLQDLNKQYEVSASIISNAVKTVKMINGNEEDFSDIIESVATVVNKKKDIKKQANDNILKDYDLSLVNTTSDMDNLTERLKACGKLNFTLCMYGEPGTGKSLYARYLAKELGIEVIQKRVSDLVSKWEGETEQNIANAFAEAKDKKAMLIFDEADSFLQNRQKAVNSWEVTEVNEVLTQMENFEYPFVCTTNLMDSLDEASLRRFTFKIKFDFMNKEQVKKALKHFFNIDSDIYIKGLTCGDFANVKKRTDFLDIKETKEIIKMLQEEVKVKKSKELQNQIGF